MDESTLNVHPHHLIPAILLYVLPLHCSLIDPFTFQGSLHQLHSIYSHTPVPGTVLGQMTIKDDTMLPQQLGSS